LNISGGQKQRLAIARSIISNPTVLLLDEATSALDPKAEHIVQQALERISKNRTTIIIAHKLSTIRNADNIVVLSNGAVVQQGSHDALLERDGPYASLVRAQDLHHAGSEEGLDEVAVRQEIHETLSEKDGPDASIVRAQDPHRTGSQETLVASEIAEDVGLLQTQGRTSGLALNGKRPAKDGIKYNLFKCLYLISIEQGHLWKWLLLVFGVTFAGGAIYPVQAILFARIIEAFQLPPDRAVHQGDFYSLMFFIVAVGILVVYAGSGWAGNVVAQHVSTKYRREIFQLILKQDMSFFDDEANASGALASHLSSYSDSLMELLGFNIMFILMNIVNVVSSSILAIAVGWKLGLVLVLIALPALVFFGYLRVRLEHKLEEDTDARFAASTALANEAVAAIRTVSSLALERRILAKYESHLQGVAEQSARTLFWTMFWYSLTQTISYLAMGLGFW
jgi:ATP-binding cassette subfamily B (MDR/TAP) protein 1